MAEVCPSVTASNLHDYNAQVANVATLGKRLHIDVADGELTPSPLIDLTNVWWPGGMRADIHVMYKRPMEHVGALLALKPQLVIVHAEAEGDFITLSTVLRRHGIEAGVALLPETPVQLLAAAMNAIDHVLVFAGKLGSYGGTADMGMLAKVKAVRALSKRVEIGWDGGVTDTNITAIAEAGAEVIVSGSYIQKAPNSLMAYTKLTEILL